MIHLRHVARTFETFQDQDFYYLDTEQHAESPQVIINLDRFEMNHGETLCGYCMCFCWALYAMHCVRSMSRISVEIGQSWLVKPMNLESIWQKIGGVISIHNASWSLLFRWTLAPFWRFQHLWRVQSHQMSLDRCHSGLFDSCVHYCNQ